MTSTFHIEVGQKGRALLPAGLRRATGIGVGTELVAQVIGEGEILLATKQAVLRRIQGGAPQHEGAVEVLEEVRGGESSRLAALGEGEPESGRPAQAAQRLLESFGLAE